MSKRGRKPLEVPRIRWQVFVNEKLAAAVELLLLDPMREKAKYGARTEYLEGLIRKDLTERRIKVDDGTANGDESGDSDRPGNSFSGGVENADGEKKA